MIKNKIESNNKKNVKEINFNKLKDIFPNVISENGEFLLDKFLEEIKSSEIDISNETYSLNWLGKSYSKLLANLETETILKPMVEHNSEDINMNSQNLYIEGDNLDALKHLNETYNEKIKMIYIDPPYNTGEEFVYNDKFNFTKEQLSELANITEEEAEKIIAMKTSKSNSHSAWLTFMYPRLWIARNLLSEDGVIFISIDDNEQANLKLVCDEVFGENNFIAILPTIMNLKGNNDQFAFSGTHEYTVVYTKAKDKSIFNEFPLNEDDIENWQEDAVGYFKKGSGLLATSEGKLREERPYMYFPILIKDNEVFLIPENEYEKIYDGVTNKFNDEFLKSLEKKYIDKGYYFLLPHDNNGQKLRWTWGYKGKFTTQKRDIIVVKTRNGYSLYKKQRPALGDLPSKKPKTIFYKPEYSSGNGTNQIKEIFSSKVFNNPKPLELIMDLIRIGLGENGIVLDFFSGSATVAHAVIQLNAEYGETRKYILVNLPEQIKEGTEAYRLGYKNICEIGQERIKRAAKKIKEETNADIDYGFKIFECVDTTKEQRNNIEKFDPNQLLGDENILKSFGKESVIYTWGINDGSLLTANIKEINIDDYTGYTLDFNTLYLLDPNISEKQIQYLIEQIDKNREWNFRKIVMFGYSFNTSEIMNVKQNIKQLKNSAKALDIDVEVRY